MGAQGNTTIDFGAFPGASDTSVTITGQAGIVAGSCVEAWIRGESSADHSSDEHLLETIKVLAKDIVAGTGFTIHVINASQVNEPLEPIAPSKSTATVTVAQKIFGAGIYPSVGGMGTRIYGVWNVSWVWN